MVILACLEGSVICDYWFCFSANVNIKGIIKNKITGEIQHWLYEKNCKRITKGLVWSFKGKYEENLNKHFEGNNSDILVRGSIMI